MDIWAVIKVPYEPAVSILKVEDMLCHQRKSIKHSLRGWDVCLLAVAILSVAQSEIDLVIQFFLPSKML